MKHLLSTIKARTAAGFSVLCLASALSANAAEPFPYDGTLQANVEYTYEAKELSATFIPSQTGEIMYNCGSLLRPYRDADHNPESFIEGTYMGYIGGSLTYAIEVTKNVPVYFYATQLDASWNPGMIFQITENQPVEILEYTTQPGEVLSLTSGYSELIIFFNQPVAAASASIRPEGGSSSISIPMSSLTSTSLVVAYPAAVTSLLDSGAVTGGDKLILTIKDIKTSSGVAFDNGNDLVLEYLAPSKPVTLLSAEIPDPFLGYWKEGDPAGIATLVYSGDLSKVQYMLKYGNFESEVPDGYIETGESGDADSLAKVTIEGNKVTINFTGVRRSPSFMVPSGTDYSEITLKVTAWDKVGEPVEGSGQGQVGSYERQLTYTYYPPADYRVQFTPATGESLKGRDYLYLHLYDYHILRIENVKFEIENGDSYLVPKADITETGGSDFDWTLSIPVPEAVKTTKSKVTVTFPGAEFLDGEDHTDEFTAVYHEAGNTGIFSLSSDGVVPEIYSVDGRRIQATDPSALAPGLYIVNGRKLVHK